MIKFKKVKMQNFLSVGSEPVELNLDTHSITSVSGDNGSAKSAICIDSVYYALYGKSFRHANIPRMVNAITKKGMLVELEFETMGNQFKIVRGVKPAVFQIWINGRLKEQTASVKDYQAYLSKHILKMDEKTFRQVVVIGSGSYVPFMSLSAAERRTVVEQLLSLDVFESLNAVLKDRTRDAAEKKFRIQEEKSKIALQMEMQKKHSRDNVERMLQQIRSCENEETGMQNRRQELKNSLKAAMANLDRKAYEEAKERLAKLDDAVRKGGVWKTKAATLRAERRKMQDFFRNSCVCPTCSQKLDPAFVTEKLAELDRQDREAEAEMQAVETRFKSVSDQRESLSQWLADVSRKSAEINRIAADIESVEQSISFLRRQKASLEEQIDAERKALASEEGNLDGQMEDADKRLAECRDESEVLDFLAQEFKDSGVKARVVSAHLQAINQLVRKYLKIVGFEVDFRFDETFSESITAKGSDSVEYANYSEGEKLRINCAILFAFRELAKMRSSVSSNLLVLDEFDQGTLDEDGFNSVVNILKSCEGQNIFVISHSTAEFDQISDRSLTARKVNGFSVLQEN